MKTSKTCPAPCPFLATESRPPGTDPVLSEAHVACAWREFEPHVRRLVVRALLRLPLRKLCSILEESGVAVRRSRWRVRTELANGNDVDELVQEVACAFVRAVQRGRVIAARPAIYRWFEQTIYFLVPQQTKHAAIAALTGSALSLRPENDNGDDGEGGPILFGSWPSPEEASELAQEADARAARLTPGQREAIVLATRGLSSADIALALGITEGAVRLRLMQARRRLRG